MWHARTMTGVSLRGNSGLRGWAKIATVAVIAGFVLLVGAGPAEAHAELLRTEPASGAELVSAPRVIRLGFSESVTVVPGGVRLIDQTGKRVEIGSSHVDHNDVVASVPRIPPGAYVLTWRVVSDDGHPVRGAFTFRVARTGSQQLAARAAESLFASEKGRSDVGAVSALLRSVSLAAMTVLLGFAGALLFWMNHSAIGSHALGRLRRVTVLVTCVSALAGVGGVFVYGPYVTGSGFGAMTDGVLLDGTLSDPVGRALVTRTMLLIVLGLLVNEIIRATSMRSTTPMVGRRSGVDRTNVGFAGTALVVASIASAVSQAYTGHGATGRFAMASTLSTAVLAAGVWIGGLVVLVLRRHFSRTDPTVEGPPLDTADLRRFSAAAFFAVAALIASGLFASWRQVGSLRALRSTTYGQLLIAKVMLVLVLVALGARNRRVLRTSAGQILPMQRRIALESTLSVGVIAITTLLTGAAPARTVVARPVNVTLTAPTLLVDLTVEPARRGRNNIHLYALKRTGLPLSVKDITATASLPSQGIENVALTLLRAGSNHFQVLGADFPIAGTWRIDATIRIDEFTEEAASAAVTIR